MLCLCASASAQTVTIVNVNGHGTNTDFFVGDSWKIDLTGTPGAAIGVNGIDTGYTIGSTGTQSFTGTIQEGSEGDNAQYWTVGGVAASPSPLWFLVESAPNDSCASEERISTSADTAYTTDSLNRWTGYVDSNSNPGSLYVYGYLNQPLFTCSVSGNSTVDEDHPEFLYKESVSVNDTDVDIKIVDKGCQSASGENVERSCNWYSTGARYPNDFDYPLFNYLWVSVTYYDRYYHESPTVSTVVGLWVGDYWYW